MAIDTTSINSLVSEFRTLSQKDSITPESLGALLQRIADLVGTCTSENDFSLVRNSLSSMTKAHKELSVKVGNVEAAAKGANTKAENARITEFAMVCTAQRIEARVKQKGFERVAAELPAATAASAGVMTVEQVASLNGALKDIDRLKTSSSGRGFVYVDIESPEILRVHGAEKYLNDDYVPYIFRYTTKANRYEPKDMGGETPHEQSRKGWHPLGNMDTTTVDPKSKVVWIDGKVFGDMEKGRTCAPGDFVKTQGQEYAYYGKRKVKLSVKKNNVEAPRRVRLKYGIGFVPRAAIDRNKRLNLGNLATNIATFRLCWETDMSDGGMYWRFNK